MYIFYTRDGSIDILQAHAATAIIYIIIMTFSTQSYTYNIPLYNKTLYAHHHSHISYPPHVWSAGLDVDVNGGSHNCVYICDMCILYIYISSVVV